MSDSYDLIVIGGGPGGYVAAIRAAQLGKKVVCIEKRKTLGGTCLNVGCIPSKALLDSSELFEQARHKFAKHGIKCDNVQLDLAAMMARKDQVVGTLTGGIAGLFRKNKVAHLHGAGKLLGNSQVQVDLADGSQQTLTAPAILLASGSEVMQIPSLPQDGKFIVGSTEALAFDKVPEHLLIVGGGYIGLELGSVWLRLGAKVTVLEFLPRILPITDGEIATMVHKSLQKQGMNFHLNTKVTGAKIDSDKVTVTAETADGPTTFTGDKVLVAVGRRPASNGLGLDAAGVAFDAKSGKIPVDAKFQTNVPGIYAIGDLIAGPMLAHKASEEGVAFAEMLDGHAAPMNYDMIPSVIYIWPEVSSVGPTEEQLKERGITYKVGKFPIAASGRARAMDETEGVVKVITDAATDRVLAVHIFGPRASEMIAEAVTTMEFSGSAEDITRIVHSHPTLSESLAEAARAAFVGKALHA
ncbi:dihydrolipoyl dehydrogenase [Tuwongella immobilis]|uniref:Dihydrolipoyl dehydrogenase n=1 Tax=Tuwongella immobilis TaxID=692036 RepID=A0A6C2YTE6_9BACT|nr:dihydrolipoyl dehydrogenase [Tuwongella immobilis]VIP04684.1 dihydrolipoamide dehydrogenase : Dihydrolipoyl dehydrogenase OS=Singulisphaera acidiphila (strain ATCC BAA-1392 / DSM 18658 / VKM B-2454 / MOB10) GN=Sinac_6538 PE=3 SV=1: Pyr_redox_2: Pyr_redox: Pyr_redox_dim [Tuwongella immobilis]VTS06727.1 dihydrolipoamide dehydrogenase : Dihydrolipoyl dehydrogenase OS=Singulisphaera acidiphila (strain ATCC BAA-1392 / DSM 18658 / VKM B-2454 / MOB10) GN=Sinac_6538 PE=3 SV=1: Pyr_redox_2: Pyr_redox: 